MKLRLLVALVDDLTRLIVPRCVYRAVTQAVTR